MLDWNATAATFPNGELCIHELFELRVQECSTNTALVFREGSLSFGELNRRANQLAHHLRKSGVKSHDRVGICIDRGPEMVIAVLAVLKSGAAYVPLDPEHPLERIRYMVHDSAPVTVITQPPFESRVHNPRGSVIDITRLQSSLENSPETNLDQSTVCSDDLAYIVYTSGSTGTPKGVMGAHRAIVNRLLWMQHRYPFATDEVCCALASLTFVDSVCELFGPLTAGAPLVLLPAMPTQDFMRAVERHRVTRLTVVPSLLATMCQIHLSGRAVLPQLRYWISSGDALTTTLAQQLFACAPHTTLLNLYGSSEDAADVTYFEVPKNYSAGTLIPIGRPISNTEIYILDDQCLPVPPGVTGEIYVGGVPLAQGYVNKEALTIERFVPNPFNRTFSRMYRTGDLGRWTSDGNIEFLGRIDARIKIRGELIEPGEIEACLMECEWVREAVVVCEKTPSSEMTLVAYVVVSVQVFDESELSERVGAKLPGYMHPARYDVVPALPLTPNGKIDRQGLADPSLDLRTGAKVKG